LNKSSPEQQKIEESRKKKWQRMKIDLQIAGEKRKVKSRELGRPLSKVTN